MLSGIKKFGSKKFLEQQDIIREQRINFGQNQADNRNSSSTKLLFSVIT